MSDGGWAFVDVETTGLNPSWDRVVSVSVVAVDGTGALVGELHSLVDPKRDPGPVHIHGLTRERLAGAPLFHTLAPQVHELTHGRVLVAHNAQFDYRFLHAETERSSVALPTTHRLCTVALSRRLDLPVADHKLATVAAYWGVRQHRAHDARDDVRVLREVFGHSHAFATRLGVELPVLACSGRGAIVYPASIPRVPSQFVNPGSWVPPARLVQGMKIVITGPTARPRLELAKDLSARGFDVMNSVSGQTRLLVCNEAGRESGKADRARTLDIPVLTEPELVAMLEDVAPGLPRAASAEATPSRAAPVSGPWSGRSVLVIGGSAAEAAEVRDRVGTLGARVLVNLGARTTHALCLDGAERDPRHAKLLDRAIPLLTVADLDGTATTPTPQIADMSGLDIGSAVVMSRGQVIDLPSGSLRYSLSTSWQSSDQASLTAPFEVDVVALALVENGLVGGDHDLVFYNQPSTPDGGIRLTVDGDCEQGVDLDLEALDDATARVRIAAAIDGEVTFGVIGAIRLSMSDADTGKEVASATLDAATTEQTLVLAEIYRRDSTWRFRVIGQGYEHGLDQLVTAHGIEIDPA